MRETCYLWVELGNESLNPGSSLYPIKEASRENYEEGFNVHQLHGYPSPAAAPDSLTLPSQVGHQSCVASGFPPKSLKKPSRTQKSQRIKMLLRVVHLAPKYNSDNPADFILAKGLNLLRQWESKLGAQAAGPVWLSFSLFQGAIGKQCGPVVGALGPQLGAWALGWLHSLSVIRTSTHSPSQDCVWGQEVTQARSLLILYLCPPGSCFLGPTVSPPCSLPQTHCLLPATIFLCALMLGLCSLQFSSRSHHLAFKIT